MSTLSTATLALNAGNNLTTAVLDATTDMVAFGIMPWSTTAIKKIQVWISTKAHVSSGDINVVITTNALGMPVVSGGVPTDAGGGSPTLVTVSRASLTAGATYTFTFTNGFTPTADTRYWVVFYPTGTWDASNSISIGTSFSGAFTNNGLEPSVVSADTGSSWTTTPTTMAHPSFTLLDASDNCLNTFSAVCVGAASASAAFTSSSNPDEYGNMFTTPANYSPACYGMLDAPTTGNFTTADFSVYLIRDPLGTPTIVDQVDIDISVMRAASYNGALNLFWRWPDGPHTLDANTVYAVTKAATGAGTITIYRTQFASNAARLAAYAYKGISQVARQNGTGAYTETNTLVCNMVPVLAFADGSASGGLKIHPGMGGGING